MVESIIESNKSVIVALSDKNSVGKEPQIAHSSYSYEFV